MVALIESKRRSEWMGKEMVASIAAHSAIVAVLLSSTDQAVADVRAGGPGETVIWIEPATSERKDEVPDTGSGSTPVNETAEATDDAQESESLPTVAFDVSVDVPRDEFQLPALKLDSLVRTRRSSNERPSTHAPVAASGSGEEAIAAGQAERLPATLRPPIPHYPALLRERAIEGAVVVQFTIDRRGFVQPASIRILASDQALFDDEVRRALVRARYRPAEIAGRPVAVIVQQRFAFRLQR